MVVSKKNDAQLWLLERTTKLLTTGSIIASYELMTLLQITSQIGIVIVASVHIRTDKSLPISKHKT